MLPLLLVRRRLENLSRELAKGDQSKGGRSGRNYPHCEPSAKSAHKLREAVREETAPDTLWKQPEEVIRKINQRMRGWAGYFHYGNSMRVLAKLQWYVEARVGRWLWKKHAKTRGRYAPEHTRGQLRER